MFHKNEPVVDLKRLCFNTEDPSVKALKPLGSEFLCSAKFWLLFLTLVRGNKPDFLLKGGLKTLHSLYGLEDNAENWVVLEAFMPDDCDMHEESTY